MKIIFACGAMPFGPETPSRASLGGSETAALMLAKAMAARGHDVTMFCNLPLPPAPDAWPSGNKHDDGVRYVGLGHFEGFVTTNPHDVLIALRDPKLVSLPSLSKKKVLWMHDIATKRGYQRAFEQMQFTFDEVWAVSEWHKAQIAETTGYPENRIVALRNGIVKYPEDADLELLGVPVEPKEIIYAARPERGLDNLIRPGGVMENLPDYTLTVVMYEHFPEHMREYYEAIFARMRAMPNVRFVGGKPNRELRQMIGTSAAYIYPTQFEETSCILARECIEQGTPFITTSVGALPETLGECGIYFEDWLHQQGITEPERGTPGWCKLFATFFRETMENEPKLQYVESRMVSRTDLYWDGVAAMAEPHLYAADAGQFSRIWSLLQDGDAVAALALRDHLDDDVSENVKAMDDELALYRRMLSMPLDKYYDEIYRGKVGTEADELAFSFDRRGMRYQAIADELRSLPPGATVFEYGCGPGHVLAPLAREFPHLAFVGFDFAPSCAELIWKGIAEHGLTNLVVTSVLAQVPHDKHFDAVICTEVLEHVAEPWELLEEIESYVKPGGRVICTTPFGAWEPISYEQSIHRWKERFHLWQIDQPMFKEMVGVKPNEKAIMMLDSARADLRPIGQLLFSYDANHTPINPISALAKAARHYARHTVAAAVIAYNNEDSIVRMLNSLEHQVQFVQIAHGPSTDRTRQIIDDWFADRPWVRYRVIDVPKIEPYKFGFDDARNASVAGLTSDDFEWILWIDTDEYLAGNFRKYLRDSALDGYLIAQHHFTVEPRGSVTQIDRPCRLFRTDRGYRARGHIHEHFEVPIGGPGRATLLADVDIGHTGYVNEAARRGRFFRNFPFLEWDHEEGSDRKLHHFLWLRDLIHRMRFDSPNRVKLAHEAISYYNGHQEDMATFGPGLFMALDYITEAYTVLGVGVPVQIAVSLDDRNTQLKGRFESYEQLEKVLAQILKVEFTERTSRYY